MGEHIRNVYRPGEKEQSAAEEQMTVEQGQQSKQRETEYRKQEKNEIELFADIHDKDAVRALHPLRGRLESGREEKFGSGYVRNERLWISGDGKIYWRENLIPLAGLNRGEAAESTDAAREISKEKALGLINFSLELAQDKIKYAKATIGEFTAYSETLKKEKEKIERLK